MPTTYTDQFYTFDPANPPPPGTAVNVSLFDLVDQNNDGDIDRFNNDRVNGSDVQSSWPGDTVTINVPGIGNVTYTGITFYLANGQRVFTPTDGQVLRSGSFVSSSFVNTEGGVDAAGGELGPPCFTPGTRIATPEGERPVEDIRVGDLVLTRDSGPQPVIWAGRRTVDGTGDFAPIRIEAGVLGNVRPLLVSPQHRMLLRGWQAELALGLQEVLVAATHLVDGDRVRREPCDEVTYLHLMLPGHEIIFAEGAATESLDPHGDFARDDRVVGSEIARLFPELRGHTATAAWKMPPSARRFEARAALG
jgi:hypothetical protein